MFVLNMLPWAPFGESEKNPRSKRGGSVDTGNVSGNGSFLRNKTGSAANLWRPNSLANLVNPIRKRGSAVFDSSPTNDNANGDVTRYSDTALVVNKTEKKEKLESPGKKNGGSWNTIVGIVLVEAKGLPDSPTDGYPHGVYCKMRLGSQTLKSKTVQNLSQPEWRERFQLHMFKDHLLRVSLWDKGKQKTFMGSSVLDLSHLEQERTHEIWQNLDNGYGTVHLSVTICDISKKKYLTDEGLKEIQEISQENKHAFFNTKTNWKLVGQLYVKIVSAKGLSGRPSAYCSLEVDNERVRTHSTRSSSEPTWNKSFVFNVYDVTSTLDLKVYDSSLMTTLHNESLGRVSIPLLRIQNGEMKWYALKDKSKRSGAKGNCPRVLLEMSFFWNPVKASLRVFQPRELKYIKKPEKFDIALVYKNLEFVRDAFTFLHSINDMYKRLFEWDNQELSFGALCCWLIFWYYFKSWAVPLLLLVPFFYFWICNRHQLTVEKSFMRGYGVIDTPDKDVKGTEKTKTEKSLTNRIQELPEMSLKITSSVDYIASLSEKMYNLASFKVPFLSYLTMNLLVMASACLYLIPFNYLMMILGIYKFTRKVLRPDRILNNDLEDFLSRIPDTEILNDWKELNVPEPIPANGINIGNQPYTFKDAAKVAIAGQGFGFGSQVAGEDSVEQGQQLLVPTEACTE